MSFAKTVREIVENHPVTDPRGALIAIEKALEEHKARKAATPPKPEVIFSLEITSDDVGSGCVHVKHPGFPEAKALALIAASELRRFVACEGK